MEISFDIALKAWDRACSTRQDEQLINDAYFTLATRTAPAPDMDPRPPDLPSTTVKIGGLPVCEAAPPIAITKKMLLPAGGKPDWNEQITYEITITNQSAGTLTGLGLEDYVYIDKPPFTAFVASSVTCDPACIAPAAVSSPLFVGGSFTYLFGLKFKDLAAGANQRVKYDVRYDMPCTTAKTAPSITNRAWVTNPASRILYDEVVTLMPQRPPCALQAVKTLAEGPGTSASFDGVFPATLKYKVEFRNTSATQSVRVGTIFDVLTYDGAAYAKELPVRYGYSCTAEAEGSSFPLPDWLVKIAKKELSDTSLKPSWRLIDFSRAEGLLFPPKSAIRCDVTVMVLQPPKDDGLCQGAGKADLVNTAVIEGAFDYPTTNPTAVIATPLPKCVSITVGKTVEREVFAGGPVTFLLTVKNGGNDPVANVVLSDKIPAGPTGFTNVSWTCASGCAVTSGSGNVITTPLDPIAPGATITVTVTATAPNIVGSYCNDVTADFNPVPSSTFFEGDRTKVTRGTACVTVQPPLPSKAVLMVKKVVEGQPPGFKAKFTFLVQCATPAGPYKKEVAVDWPLPGFTVLNDIPPGSDCLVTEGALPSPLPAGLSWSGLPVYAPAGTVKVTPKGATITVANKLASCNGIGQVTITKIVEGLPKDYAGVFQGTLQCWSGVKLTTTQIRLAAPAELTTTVGNIPLGSSCTFQETVRPTLPPGWQWSPPLYSPAFGTVTADSGGCKQIVVTNRARQCCAVE